MHSKVIRNITSGFPLHFWVGNAFIVNFELFIVAGRDWQKLL